MKQKIIYCCLAILVIFSANLLYAQEITVVAKTDKTNAVLGETVILQIEEQNVDNPVQPQIPPNPAFDIKFIGQSQPSTFQTITINNGVRTESKRSTTSFKYEITPKNIGNFTIPPIQVTVQGKNFTTEPINITVFQEAPGNQFMSVEILSDAKEYYLNQQVGLTIQITSNKPIAGEITCNIPWFDSFEGFLAQEMDFPQGGQKFNVIINGKYRIPFNQEVKVINNEQRLSLTFKRIFFPIAAGDFNFQGVSMQAVVATELGQDMWGQTIARQTSKVVKTGLPLSIKINPLPEENKPAQFGGGVGFFRMDVQAQPKKVKVGDSIDLTVKIEGEGNIDQIAIPVISDLNGFKTYPAKSETKITDKINKIAGEKSFYQTIVPTEAGKREIPPLIFAYFDPFRKAYQVLQSAPIPIEVEKGETDMIILDTPMTQDDVEKIRILKKDIFPIIRDISTLRYGTKDFYQNPMFLIVLLFPPLLILVSLLARKRQDRFRNDFGYVRFLQASKACKKNISNACKLMDPVRVAKSQETKQMHGATPNAVDDSNGVNQSDLPLPQAGSKEFYNALAQAITNFLADKLNLPPASVTPDYIAQQLSAKGIQSETLKELKTLFESFDYGRFATSQASMEDKQKTLKKTEELIKIVGKKLRYE